MIGEKNPCANNGVDPTPVLLLHWEKCEAILQSEKPSYKVNVFLLKKNLKLKESLLGWRKAPWRTVRSRTMLAVITVKWFLPHMKVCFQAVGVWVVGKTITSITTSSFLGGYLLSQETWTFGWSINRHQNTICERFPKVAMLISHKRNFHTGGALTKNTKY